VAYGAAVGLLINIGLRPGYELGRQSLGPPHLKAKAA
jgi:hypothetical protein